jgi:hypothetical protein
MHIVDRLAIREQDYPKISTFHLGDTDPATYASIPLDMLMQRSRYCSFDPLIEDQGTIGSAANRGEVGGDRHLAQSGRGLTQQANRRPTRGRKPAGGRPVERRVRHQTFANHGDGVAVPVDEA